LASEELNSDEVMALLASLESAGGSDRRRHPRTPAAHHVTAVVRRAGSAPLHAAVRDLSCSGVGIYSPIPMDPDAKLDIQLSPHGRPVQASCRVASCQLNADGRYAIGLEFIQIARVPVQSKTTTVVRPAPAPAAPVELESDPAAHVDEVSARLQAALDA
jgi:hypothetical protein